MLIRIDDEIVKVVSVYAVTLSMLFSAYPYMFFQLLPLPSIKILSAIFFLLYLFILFVKRKITIPNRIILYTLFFQVLFLFISFIYHSDTTYITRIVLLLLTFGSILCLNNTKLGIIGFIKFYNNIILLMAVAGCLCFIIKLFIPFEPISVFVNPDGRPSYFYGLSFTNYQLGNIIRYSGFFDEPGAIANWGIFALLFNYLFIHNKKYERILSICLLFTFSVAYYIQILFFILVVKRFSIRKFFYLFIGIFIIIGAILFTKDSEIDLYRLTLYRLEINEETGGLQGDNRSELAEKSKEQFVKYPLMGQGAQKISDMDYMADNPYEILAKDGILGTLMTYLPLLVVLFVKFHKQKYVFSIILLFLGYLQRPFHIDLVHPMMLYCMFYLMIMYDNLKNYPEQFIYEK